MTEHAIDLSIDPSMVYYILTKAREFDEKTPPSETDPGSNPADDRDVSFLEDQPNDPTFTELLAAIDNLNEDEQADLVALAWLGRGDFGVEGWVEARRDVQNMSDKHIPEYLATTPLLAAYLEEGLSMAGYYRSEIEVSGT